MRAGRSPDLRVVPNATPARAEAPAASQAPEAPRDRSQALPSKASDRLLARGTVDQRGTIHRTSAQVALRASHGLFAAGAKLSGAGALIETTDMKGRPASFTLEIGPNLAKTMKRGSLQIDTQTAELVYADGTRTEITGVRDALRAELGKDVPPWTLRARDCPSYGPPNERATLDLEGDTLRFRLPDGLRMPFGVLPKRNLAEVPIPTVDAKNIQSLPPETCQGWKQVQVAEDVRLTGPNDASIARAQTAIRDVLGKALSKHDSVRSGLKKGLADIKRLKNELLPLLEETTPAAQAATQKARNFLGQFGGPEWTPLDAFNALHAVQAQMEDRLKPVDIIVVPSGVNYAQMPQLVPYLSGLESLEQVGQAARVDLAGRAFVFLPEDDLAGDARISKHELFHQLEAWWPTATRAAVTESFQKTHKEGGTFVSRYGSQRVEFISTLGEEFSGQSKAQGGPSWVKREHPAVYEILASATGQRPE